MSTKSAKVIETETEVAILQVQVKNIEDKVGEIKEDLREMNLSIHKGSEVTQLLLKDMKDTSATAHKAMSDKISSLEKWRWMMMGAGIVIGSMGFSTVGNLLK